MLPAMQYLAECRAFFAQFRDQYTTTGSIMPSGRRLARALAKPFRRGQGPRRLLEVGPGTGSVTSEIVKLLRPEDVLDIVEINGAFVDVLRRRFEIQAHFRRVHEQSRILHAPLQEVPGEGVYDFIISGLPLNNFPMALVEDIFASYERLLKPGGTLSYFEYVWIRQLKMPFVSRSERERLQTLSDYLQHKIRRHQVDEDVVMLNVPPAVARHFRFVP